MNIQKEMIKEVLECLPEACLVFGDYVKDSILDKESLSQPLVWRPYDQAGSDVAAAFSKNLNDDLFEFYWYTGSVSNLSGVRYKESGQDYNGKSTYYLTIVGKKGSKFGGRQVKITWVIAENTKDIIFNSTSPENRLWMNGAGKVFAENGVDVETVVAAIKNSVLKNGLIVNENGTQRWYKNDKLHNENGPAVSYSNPNGYEAWYKDGILHRTDGAAINYDTGEQSFYINGIQYTEKVYWERIEALGLKNLSKENKEVETNRRIEMKQGFTEMVKSDAEDAAYRIGAFQGSKLLQKGLVEVLRKQGMSKKGLNALTELFETELGRAFLMGVIGVGATQIPALAEMPKLQRIAKECRVSGMAVAGNFAIDGLVSGLAPELMKLLNSLPEPTVQARIEVPSVVEAVGHDDSEEEVLAKEPKKKLKAV
jgi:hypothetical protein